MKQAVLAFLLGVLSASAFFFLSPKQKQSPQNRVSESTSSKEEKPFKSQDTGAVLLNENLTNPRNSSEAYQGIADVFGLDLPTLRNFINSPEIKRLNPYDTQSRALVESLFSRYFQLAPEEALSALDAIKGDLKSSAVSGLFKEWAQKDLNEALAHAADLSDKDIKETALSKIFETLSTTDPEKAFTLSQEHGLRWAHWGILMNWSKTDPVAAIEKSKELKEHSDWMRSTLMRNWAHLEPDKALAYLEGITNKTERKNLGAGLLQALVKDDPQLAFGLINKLSNPLEKSLALGLYYHEMVNKEPSLVAEQFLQNDFKKIGNYSVGDFLSVYSKQSPEAAKEFFNSISDPMIKDNAVSALIRGLSSKDPEAAMEFAFTQPPTAGLRNAMWALGDKIGSKDPQTGIQNVLERERNSMSGQLLGGIYSKWARRDFDAALQGLQLLEQDDVPDVEAYRSIARNYADNPEEAVKWIETIRTGADKYNATTQLVQIWSQSQPDAAAEWANSLPEGGHRDSAARSLVRTFSSAEPRTALEWAASISNEDSRNQILKRTFKVWKTRERASALEWLETADTVTDQQRESWSAE